MMNKKSKLLKDAKFLFHTFADKELTLFAASLSFYTIFSFIPLLLILMTVLTSLKSFSDIYMKIQDFIPILEEEDKIFIDILENITSQNINKVDIEKILKRLGE